MKKPLFDRPPHYVYLTVVFACFLSLTGCTTPAIRSQSPDNEELPEIPETTQLVEDLARPTGLKTLAVEGIGLVVGLDGTGGDPPPSSRREILINEMRTHRVFQPNRVLASPETSLVLVRAFLPPGIQEGERVDLEVLTPSNSTTTSLKGGYLMKTRLREIAVLNSQITQGKQMAIGQGDVLVDALLDGEDDGVMLTKGRVLGGALSKATRALGLVVSEEHHSVRTSAKIGAAINRRFNIYKHGSKRGVATPKRDNFIQLDIHPRYKDNLARYLQVVQSIAVREDSSDRLLRLQLLEHELLNPSTSARAARRLEAMGKEAERVLIKGIESANEEVRFYAAESLAYLDHAEAPSILADTIRRMPAFRHHALVALKSMEQPKAFDELSELLHVDSAETRYAAFRALLEISPSDPMLVGENLDDVVFLHELGSAAQPLVHISRSTRPEIVAFGEDVRFASHSMVFAGGEITVRSDSDNRLKVTRFSAKKGDLKTFCDATVPDMVRAVVELGGSYDDVVKAIVQAHRQGNLACRVEFDALPELGRTYHRKDRDEPFVSDEDVKMSDEDPELKSL